MDKNLIQCGHRIKKDPYLPKFRYISSELEYHNQSKMLKLIIALEEKLLVETQENIKYKCLLPCFHKQKMDIKKSKFKRNLEDYQSDSVHNWNRKVAKSKCNFRRSKIRVKFSFTEGETSDSSSEAFDSVFSNLLYVIGLEDW